MRKYTVIALNDLEAEHNTWTKGLDYEAVETATKFQLTSNECQVAYMHHLKPQIMANFKAVNGGG